VAGSGERTPAVLGERRRVFRGLTVVPSLQGETGLVEGPPGIALPLGDNGLAYYGAIHLVDLDGDGLLCCRRSRMGHLAAVK
jgi:hypothetical protein